jgi:photosystem II stability/assembly factor-like uncharacterized protein
MACGRSSRIDKDGSMNAITRNILAATLISLGALAAGLVARPDAAEVMPVSELPAHTHIHGLAVDGQDPSRLLIATHHGLFRTGPDGTAERVSEVQDFMGFTPHPRDPGMLYASGHPGGGGNLGFIASTDQGGSWTQVSPGLNGPVDFHQLTVSPADPRTIYGAYGGLQLSRDGGATWSIAGPAPDRLIDLAASARDASTLYAATETGLLVSSDAGATWSPIVTGAPVSVVEVTPDGALYAFVLGQGLVRSGDPPAAFETVSNAFGEGYLLHLAGDPADPSRLFAATGEGRILASADRGRSWAPLTGSGQ